VQNDFAVLIFQVHLQIVLSTRNHSQSENVIQIFHEALVDQSTSWLVRDLTNRELVCRWIVRNRITLRKQTIYWWNSTYNTD